MSGKTGGESQFEESAFYISPGQFQVHIDGGDFLGQGSFGSVYRCYHDKHGEVAIKMFNVRGSRHVIDGVFRTVRKEMEMMLLLQKSPQVVGFYGVTIVGNCTPGLVMEYLPRGSLSDLVQKSDRTESRRVPWCLMLRIMQETASGLAYLHETKFDERVTHNDLKPENILLDSNFHAKLCDFGGSNLAIHTSCKTRSTPRRNPRNTDVHHTVYYAAPEYLSDEVEERTRAMDVFSYGMILFFVLKKFPPFRRFESSAVIMNVTQGNRPVVHISDILEQEENLQSKKIVEIFDIKMRECWQQDPPKRPHIDLVANDLNKLLDGVGQEELELAIHNLSEAISIFQESDKHLRVDLDKKNFPEFTPKLEIPFISSSQDETRPLLAFSGTFHQNNKATNSLMYNTWHKEPKNLVANEAPNPTETQNYQPIRNQKATCSSSVLGKRQIPVKNATEIDISHSEKQVQKGDKVYIKTKSRLAICVVEDDLPYWPPQDSASSSSIASPKDP